MKEKNGAKTYTCTENISFKQFVKGENGVTKKGVLIDELFKTRISYILSIIAGIAALVIALCRGSELSPGNKHLCLAFAICVLVYALINIVVFDIYAVHLLRLHAKNTATICTNALYKVFDAHIDEYDSFEEAEKGLYDLLKEASQKEFNHYLAQNLHFLGNYLPHYYHYTGKYSDIMRNEMIKKIKERKNG